MEDKKFINALKKCINDQCSEKCFLYKDYTNCQFHLLDEIMFKMGIAPEDYIDWLVEKIEISK